ncbi:MAG: type I glyceraldehyde-3-phosphate dehydrogenase [Bacilli bacterium]|nr:type I glyceraldehyde-3-phosphate dehydrogenase [Bacilli bacterium]
MIKVAINGFGRIGRLVFRIMEEDKNIEVVAINDLTDPEQLAYLLKYDTSHRRYLPAEITYDEDGIIVKGRKIKIYSQMDPNNLPWKQLDIDAVFECTGKFTDKEKAMAHINAGAKKVIISAPAKGELKTIVYGVNENTLTGDEQIISAASCTTNCLAPVLDVLNNNFGIEKGYMTTVHAYTNDQTVLDVPHKKGIKSRRGRASAANIIPTSTGAASAIGKVIPSLKGKLDGSAIRVPVTTGSVIDLTLQLNTKVTKEQINEAFKQNTNETLGYTTDPIVSSDIIGDTHGGVVDSLLTSVLETENGDLVKVVAWYDNEMSYSSQMVRTAKYLFKDRM